MNLFRHWKLILGMSLAFFIGFVLGGILIRQAIYTAVVNSLKIENVSTNTMVALDRRLKLSDEQRQKVQAVVDDMTRQLRDEFNQAFQQAGKTIIQAEKRIDQELTPEQKPTLDLIKQEIRDGLQKNFNLVLPKE